ncbi:MAG: DUF2213 domain-containing protein [Actinobacteria bacterium]|nr:DUF2213 domain-containing protein [Actinomycetota bacterium]
MAETVQRFDAVELRLDKAERLDNGWLRVPATIGSVGVFEYYTADGKVVREYRPPEEVLDPASIASFEAVPLTNDHPPTRLDAANARSYSSGSVGGVHAAGRQVDGTVLVTDASTVAAAAGGKRQLSPGYTVVLDPTPGVTPEGEHYDAIQRRIRGNHVALVQDGRQGPNVALRMDSGAAMARSLAPEVTTMDDEDDKQDGKGKAIKAMIGDSEFEISSAEAKAVKKLLKDMRSGKPRGDADDLEQENAKLRGRIDALEAAAKADREDAAARIDARVELVATARRIIGDTYSATGRSDAQVMADVVVHVDPSAKDAVEAHKADAGYIRGRYDVAITQAAARSDSGKQLLKAAESVAAKPAAADPATAAKAAADAQRRDAWKHPRTTTAA